MTPTPEQIHAMQAGRETDVAVAETVMGFRWRRPADYLVENGTTFGRMLLPDPPTGWYAEHTIPANDDDPLYHPNSRYAASDEWRSGVPRYSTDIGAAWLVVEHLHRTGNKSVGLIDPCIKVALGETAHCEIFDLSDLGYVGVAPFKTLVVRAETPMLAICRAALLVLAGRQEGQR